MEQATLDVRTAWEKQLDNEKNTKTTKEEATFTFALTEAEKATTMEEVVVLTKELNATQKEFGDIKKSYKETIDRLDTQIASLVHRAEVGVERKVLANKTLWFDTSLVTFTDDDGVVLHERPMVDSDKQLVLVPEVQAAVEGALVEHSSEDESTEIRKAARENTSTLDAVNF